MKEKGQDVPFRRDQWPWTIQFATRNDQSMTTTNTSRSGQHATVAIRRGDGVAPARHQIRGDTMGSSARVLIIFGSKRGGTAGLVDMVADALMESGCEVIISPAKGVADFHGIDAVIVAGSLYANRWNRDARRFVRRNTAALRILPVWLISSGPLDDSAKRHTIPPTKQVAKLAARIHARGHITFGGRLTPDAKASSLERWPKTALATGEMKLT